MPATYLKVYPKMAEALPTIEKKNFRSPLTNKERKKKILNNPENFPEIDNIVFAHSIIVLLSDLATNILQFRMSTLRHSSGGFSQAQQIQDTAPVGPLNKNSASNNQQSFCARGCGKFKENRTSKADKRPMGLKHCKEVIQDSVQKSESRQAKSFDKKKFTSSREIGAKQLIQRT
ncbi:hypothetical protein BB561_005961 [Smittium simulii]|uniref:Uncharacterized protein n=1 Tax=Smittium simulii TaxID=133385 RepID=A0A2T9Y798_9FUNG|nr:hypothetical protein BB561_005961 [Smittium simulii]